MSTNGDNIFTGAPDVVEQQSSIPYSGRSRGGRHYTNSRGGRVDSPNSSVSSGRGRGKFGRTGGRMRSNQKDSLNEQVINYL